MEKKNILYAEDDIGNRKFILSLFKDDLPEANLEIFEDGASLEKRLQKGSKGIDLILTDNYMPCINGGELIKKYAKSSDFEKIPFILYYGGEKEIGEQALKDGAFAYMTKPGDLDEIVGVVRKALNLNKK